MKLPSVRLAKREELGLRVKGTGEGDKVKGHAWERGMKGKTRTRKEAMVGMPTMVREWKQVSSLCSVEIAEFVLSGVTERTRSWMEEVAKISKSSL